jgi:uncharacterized protein YybS (DUF2232 family)
MNKREVSYGEYLIHGGLYMACIYLFLNIYLLLGNVFWCLNVLRSAAVLLR